MSTQDKIYHEQSDIYSQIDTALLQGIMILLTRSADSIQ